MTYNVKIVPVCINYDRIFDSEFFASDILTGQYKPETNLMNIVYKILKKREGQLGKVFVKYAEPIDLDTYVSDFAAQNRPTDVDR